MKAAPEDLEQAGYILLDRLEHRDLVPFVKKYLYRRGFWPVAYLIFILVNLGFIALLIRNGLSSGHHTASAMLGYTALGFVPTFLLIPLHEFIHAAAYRICGATAISFDADCKKLVFMAMAHRFVAGTRAFGLIAIAPLAVISLLALMLIPLAQGYQVYLLAGLLFTHTTFCGGDIAMLSYLRFHRDKHIATWDDKVNKVSYFYGKMRTR